MSLSRQILEELRSGGVAHRPLFDFTMLFLAPDISQIPEVVRIIRRLSTRATQVSLPQPTIQALENYSRSGVGGLINLPYLATPSAGGAGRLEVTFLEDAQNSFEKAFTAWMNKIINPITEGMTRPYIPGQVQQPFEVKFLRDITGVARVRKLVSGDARQFSTEYTFFSVYPLAVRSSSLDWSAAGDVLTTQVTFCFFDYRIRML